MSLVWLIKLSLLYALPNLFRNSLSFRFFPCTSIVYIPLFLVDGENPDLFTFSGPNSLWPLSLFRGVPQTLPVGRVERDHGDRPLLFWSGLARSSSTFDLGWLWQSHSSVPTSLRLSLSFVLSLFGSRGGKRDKDGRPERHTRRGMTALYCPRRPIPPCTPRFRVEVCVP